MKPANPQTPPGELLAEALAKWKALPCDERNGERPFVMGFNEGWESALASLAAVDHCDDAHLLDAFYAAIPEKFCTDISGHRASVAAADPLSEDDLCWLRGIKAAIRLAHAKEQAGVDHSGDATNMVALAPASSVGEGDLRHKLRMVVSHATGGHLDLQDAPNLSVNDICVQISQHHNRVWEGGMEKGRASTLSTPDRAPASSVPDGMKPWHGGDSAPADWDPLGPVLLADGQLLEPDEEPLDWSHHGGEGGCLECWCIVAYTPKAPDRAPAPADAALVEALAEALSLIREQARPEKRVAIANVRLEAIAQMADDTRQALAALRSPDDLAKGRGA